MNRRRHLLLATLSIALCAPPLAASEDDPVGMVLRTQGDSLLRRSGEERPVRVADLLYPNDLLTAAGSVSFLFCPESKTYTASPGSTLKLTAQGVQSQQGAAPASADSRRCALPRVALGAESLERAGAIRVRAAGIPEVPLYLGGLVHSSRPRFAWGKVDKASEYRLTLRSEEGEQIWRTTTPGAAADFPTDSAPLEKGIYEWQVEAVQDERVIAEGRTRFEVRPDPGLAGLANDDSLLSAVELENAGFYSEAAAIYRNLRRESPGDARIVRHLDWLYRQAGLTAASDAETPKDKAGHP